MHILDVTKNVALVNLTVGGTSLATLDVTKNVALATLTINGCPITTLKTIKSLPIIGQYVVPDGELGVVFYSTDSVVKIVSKDETKAEWGPSSNYKGAVSDTDGVANTNKIVADSPAAQWCRAKGSAWYLPAIGELKDVYNNVSILNETLSSPAVGGTQFGTTRYWSSSDYQGLKTSDGASSLDFSSGGQDLDYGNKGRTYSVRAVRAL